MREGTVESYSSRLHTGSRTYFFDVKRGPSNEVRLEVTESRKRREGFERDRIMVFEENAGRFVDELLKAVSAMGEAHGPCSVRQERSKSRSGGPDPQRTPRIQEIKQRHPNAYAPWTPEEDERLRKELADRVPIAEIARAHARQPNAIRSRAVRLTWDARFASQSGRENDQH